MQNLARRPRLLLVTQWFDPEPVPKGLKFAQKMSRHGFDVEVVTGFPNYPGGKVYEGYRIKLIRREHHGDVAITRLPLYPSHDSSRVGRALNYVTFFFSVLIYLSCFARKADVIYAYHPPLTVSMAAALSKIIRRTPVVIDIQDMWPDTLKATGMLGDGRLLQLVEGACSWVYKHVDHIVVLSNGFRELLISRNVPADKITTIYNWADEADGNAVSGSAPDVLGAKGPFRVLFAGNLGRAQGLDTVLDAAALLKSQNHNTEISFLGAGLELDRLKVRAEEEGLANVRFLPRVPLSEVGAYLQAADCLLVHLKADPLFEITVPSKTQAYLQAGKPIIMAVAGDAAQLINDAEAGIVIPSEDAKALTQAIIELSKMTESERNRLGQSASAFYAANLSLDIGTSKFAGLFRRLLRKEISYS